MNRGRRAGNRRAIAVAVCLGLLSAMAGCASGNADDSGPSGTGTDSPTSTVTVQRSSISSTVVVNGSVTASPEFLVVAPAAGRVRFNAKSAVGKVVGSGTRLGAVAGHRITSPANGEVMQRLVGDKATVAASLPLVAVRYGGFGIVANIPLEDQYRIYEGAASAKANIVSGPSGVDCTVVQPRVRAEGEGFSVLCLLPMGTPVIAGLATKIGITTAHKENVLVLPVQSVSGRVGQGEVVKVDAQGQQERVSVELGVTDGAFIEITQGLELGDTVLAFAPGVG